MKSFKTLLSLLMALMMLSLAACSSGEEEAASDEPATEAASEEAAADSVEGAANLADVVPFEPIEVDYASGLDDNGHFTDVAALDYVELGEYEGIAVPSDVHTVAAEEVDTQLEALMAGFTTTNQVTDRAIVDGDTVNIDYVGSIDGEEFEGGSTGGAGTDVTIGVTSYIDDFLEQLIGHEPGESFDIEVTFPDDYGAEHLAGKDAVFAITVNYIAEDVTPELTDAFVEENFSELFGGKTVEELKAFFEETIQTVALKEYLSSNMMEYANVSSVPDSLIDYQENAMGNYYKSAANSYQVDLDTFLTTYAGVESLDALIEQSGDQLVEAAEYALAIQAVAEDADIDVTDDMISAYFEENAGTADYSQFEELYGIAYLRNIVLHDAVLEYLIDKADFES